MCVLIKKADAAYYFQRVFTTAFLPERAKRTVINMYMFSFWCANVPISIKIFSIWCRVF